MSDFFVDEMANSLIQRMEGTPDQGGKFANLTISEMAEMCLHKSGGRLGGSSHASTTHAQSTGDFPSLVANVATKTAAKIYPKVPATFTQISDRGRMPNYRPGSVVRMKPAGIFEPIGEGSEVKHLGALEEGAEPAQLKSHGGIVSIDRRALLNDDLNILRDTGAFLARTGKRTQNLLVYQYLLSNPTLDDGVAMFAAGRSNLLTSALDKTSLNEALKTEHLFSDDNGVPYGIDPAILLCPPSLAETAAELCRNIAAEGKDRLHLIIEPLLESSYLTGSSSTAWYVLPSPQVSPVIRTLTLEGQGMAPQLGNLVRFTSEVIEFRGLLDFGVVAVSPYAVKSTGVA